MLLTFLEKSRLTSAILLFTLIAGSFITTCHLFSPNNMDAHNAHGNNGIVEHADFVNKNACCQTQDGHHFFQNMVVGIVKVLPADNFLFDIIILLFLGLWLIADKLLLTYLYRIRHIVRNLFNYLLQAFSRGILQPKIYNF